MKYLHFLLVIVIYGSTSISLPGQMLYNNDNVEVHILDENLFLLKETFRFTANILAISGEDGLLIMDTGFGEVSDDLKDAVNFLGKDVKVIINSHLHGDHKGGNKSFGEGIKKIAHAKCKEDFQTEENYFIGIIEKYCFTFSGIEIVCIPFAGGHSQCDIIVHVPDMKLVYLGDLYLSESFPLVDVGVGSKAQIVVENLKEIVHILPDDTRIISGHGKETSTGELKSYINMLEETIEIVRSAISKGASVQEMKDSDILKEYGQWGDFFDFITESSWIEQIYYSDE